MLSKEEILNYEVFKNKYLQQPISLLTKENLERLEQHCQRQLRHEAGQILREHEIVLELIDRYRELETREQKLIEKLEEDIKQYRKEMNNTHIKLNQIHYMKRIEYAKEILSILKGEKV